MIEIVIFILPTELDDLSNLLDRLNKGSKFLNQYQKTKIRFNVILGISSEIVDWRNSKISAKQCIESFLSLRDKVKWAKEIKFTPSRTINGCSTARTSSSLSDADYYIWLDSDIIFDPLALPHVIHSIDLLKVTGITEFVISPEIVRIWDSTWDCLVNQQFLHKPTGYQETHNPYLDTKLSGNEELSLEEVSNNTVIGQPYMKFAGGWFNVFSKDFFKKIPLPQEFSHYGWEDTYLMWAAHLLNDPKVKQYKIKNLIVCENYYDRITSFKNQIVLVDRRKEYKSINERVAVLNLKKYER